jgi:hypothetical protein
MEILSRCFATEPRFGPRSGANNDRSGNRRANFPDADGHANRNRLLMPGPGWRIHTGEQAIYGVLRSHLGASGSVAERTRTGTPDVRGVGATAYVVRFPSGWRVPAGAVTRQPPPPGTGNGVEARKRQEADGVGDSGVVGYGFRRKATRGRTFQAGHHGQHVTWLGGWVQPCRAGIGAGASASSRHRKRRRVREPETGRPNRIGTREHRRGPSLSEQDRDGTEPYVRR